MLGEQVSLMAIKALLIHNSIKNDESKNHIGWGKIPENLNDFGLLHRDGVVKLIPRRVKSRQILKRSVTNPI